MRKNKKYFIGVFVFCVWSLLLCQCTPNKVLQPSESENNTKEIITFAALFGSETQYQDLINTFEAQNPEIEVRLFLVTEKNPDLTILAGQADTILLSSAISSKNASYFLNLEPLMVSKDFDASGYWPDALQGCQAGEMQIGLPISLGPRLILYDQAAFDQAELAFPQPGWTWEDFRDAVQALADPSAAPPRYGFLDTSMGSSLSPQVSALLDAGQDATGLAAGLQWYLDLARSGDLGIPGVNKQADFTTLVASGQAAAWPGTLSSLASANSRNVRVGIAPYPTDSSHPAGNPISPTCAGISAGTSHPAASWAWLEYLSQNSPLDAVSFYAPAWRTTADGQNYWDTLTPETAVVVRYALEHGWYDWIHNDYSIVDKALKTAIETGEDLANLLPISISSDSLAMAPSIAKATVVAVSPPQVTVTPVNEVLENALSATYFADPEYHINQGDIIVLADEFNRTHPDMYIKIASQRIGFENTLSSIYDVNNFDCFAAPSAVISSFEDESSEDKTFSEMVYPLDPFLDAGDTALLDDLPSTILDASRIDGSLYGLPVVIRPYVVYYNATLLQELGLGSPDLDWSVEDFWALATQVADSNSDLYGYVPFGNEPFYYLSNAKYLDTTQEWPQASFENSDLIALLNQLAPLVKERSLFPYDSGGSRSNTGNYEERNDIIKFGKGALWIDQTGMPRVQNVILPQTQFKVGYAVLPIQQSLNPAFVISLFISRRATNTQVCWAWLEFLAQQQANIFKGIPMQQTILESENWANSVGNEQADVYRATLSKLKITNEANNWPPLPLSKWWADAVEAVTREGQDSNIVLHSIQFKAQDTLDCMRAAGVPPSIPYDQSYNIAIDCASASDPEYQK